MAQGTTATIVNAWQDGTYAYLAVVVLGDDTDGTNVEYTGKTPLLNADGTSKPLDQLKTELVAACKAQRNLSKGPVTQPVNLSGTVSL